MEFLYIRGIHSLTSGREKAVVNQPSFTSICRGLVAQACIKIVVDPIARRGVLKQVPEGVLVNPIRIRFEWPSYVQLGSDFDEIGCSWTALSGRKIAMPRLI